MKDNRRTPCRISRRVLGLLSCLLILQFGYLATAQNQISFSTNKPAGSTVNMKIDVKPGGTASISGVSGELSAGQYCDYTTTAQEITITGDVEGITANMCGITALTLNSSTLKKLDVSFNALTTLNLRDTPNLESLGCFANSIQELNVETCTMLAHISCGRNTMNKLTMGNNNTIRYISCHTNNFDERAMQNISDQLPDLSATDDEEQKAQIILINQDMMGGEEKNVVSDEVINSLQAKGWKTIQIVESLEFPINALDNSSVISLSTTTAIGNTVGMEIVPQEGSPIRIEGMTLQDSYPEPEGWAEYTLTDSNIKIYGRVEHLIIQEEDNLALSKIDLAETKSLKYIEIWGGEHSFSSVDVRNNETIKKLRIANINSLQTVHVENCPALEDLIVSESSINTITISQCPQLNLVSCFENKIKVDAMKKVAESLPMRSLNDSYRHFYMINSLATAPKEGNEYNDEILQTLANKNWIPYDWLDGQGEDDDNLGGKPLSRESLSTPSSVRIFVTDGELHMEGFPPCEKLSLYDASGMGLSSTTATPEGSANFVVKELPHGVYFVTSSNSVTKTII